MPLRLLLPTLLGAAGLVAFAAPPSASAQDATDAAASTPQSKATTSDTTGKADAETTPENIDVDAMARAKDVDATKPVDAAANSQAAAAAPVDANAPETKVTSAAPSQADASTPAKSDNGVPDGADAAADSKPPVSAEVKRLGATCDARATSLLDAAQRGDFASATHDFDAKMRTALTPEKMQKAWAELAQFGVLVSRGQSTIEKSDDYIAVDVPLTFEKADLYAQVACGSDGRVAGFYIKPVPKRMPQPTTPPRQ